MASGRGAWGDGSLHPALARSYEHARVKPEMAGCTEFHDVTEKSPRPASRIAVGVPLPVQ